MDDKILIINNATECQMLTWRHLFVATDYDSYVFVLRGYTTPQLEELVEKYGKDDTKCEWMWSHPEHEHNSTPVPAIILQHKKKLELIRQQIGYYNG